MNTDQWLKLALDPALPDADCAGVVTVEEWTLATDKKRAHFTKDELFAPPASERVTSAMLSIIDPAQYEEAETDMWQEGIDGGFSRHLFEGVLVDSRYLTEAINGVGGDHKLFFRKTDPRNSPVKLVSADGNRMAIVMPFSEAESEGVKS